MELHSVNWFGLVLERGERTRRRIHQRLKNARGILHLVTVTHPHRGLRRKPFHQGIGLKNLATCSAEFSFVAWFYFSTQKLT